MHAVVIDGPRREKLESAGGDLRKVVLEVVQVELLSESLVRPARDAKDELVVEVVQRRPPLLADDRPRGLVDRQMTLLVFEAAAA